MNCKNIITFIIKEQQYHLYDFVVTDLPIFEELKKSDKVETIPYEQNISNDEIECVFCILNNWTYDYNKLKINSIINIYQFMMFLTIKIDVIDNFCRKTIGKMIFQELDNYTNENDYPQVFFELICKYNNIQKINIDVLKNFKTSIDNKIILLKRKLSYDIEKNDCDIFYAKINYWIESKYSDDKNSISSIKNIKKIYNKYCSTKMVKVVYENNKFKEFLVNDKIVEIYGDTDICNKNFIGINLFDTIVNHIAHILVEKIEL